ncbi:hypothetical protein K443DRAFT_6103 [Laccaria amethystina LaAM-08-1]|uniref:Uncharacterized protein n=1 Tax=Laccaria amethystina LaAM-08-1 TaxID=1095629 RepID=A0A0C9XLN9_9AGAR|nr:hypothetical protein K443DRAFT_6103 [Laccaria amethystina LaAM-08-1]
MVARDSGWESDGGGGDGHARPRLPLVVVVVAYLWAGLQRWCGRRMDGVVEDGG